MSLDEALRYPAGITPHGEYHLLGGEKPAVSFHAHDGSIEFRLLGGLAAPYHDPSQPAVSVASLSGLLAPWQFVTQKGATQHGVTTVASLGDPIEITAEVDLTGPDAKATMRLVRDWIAANEQMKTGELAVITHQMGRWWVDARWAKTPPNKILAALRRRQPFTQTWTVDSSFWQTYPVTDTFRIVYSSVADGFGVNTTSDLGDDWDVDYSGDGGGNAYVNGGEIIWVDDELDPVGSTGRDMVARRVGFTTDDDNQVVEITIGRPYASASYWLGFGLLAQQHVWARMANTGTPGADGIRLSIGAQFSRLSYFVSGTETVLREWVTGLPPVFGDTFTLVCGYEGNARLYKVFRNGAEIQSVVESGTGSHLGEDYRSAGLGLHVGDASWLLTDRMPTGIRGWSAGDNASATTQSGFIKLTNIGDQPMPPRYTCFGPGLFTFANGPGSTEYVQFGPLLPNQVMQVNTDREARPVVDMTSIPPTPQELNVFQQALRDFISFATAGNVPPLLQQLESMFGIVPPQGHPYRLLSGSFSNPIPPKSPGKPAVAQHIAVSIAGGNASSMILAAGTPLRKYPL